jgi:preprotein translocase subunit YajC
MRQIQIFSSRFLALLLSTIAFSSQALAQTAGPVAGQPAAPSISQVFIQMLPAFCMAFLIFHFLVVRPQRTKLKTQQDLLGSLKKGDNVVTTGGIHGRVAAVEKDYILLEVASSVKLKLEREHIARRLETEKASQAAA